MVLVIVRYFTYARKKKYMFMYKYAIGHCFVLLATFEFDEHLAWIF